MTPTTPSPISDQAALLHRLNDATKPVDAADRNLIIRALSTAPTTISSDQAAGEPIPMLLFCPKCHAQHIDAKSGKHDIVHRQSGTVVDTLYDWDNPPHKSHLCHACGNIWRPADVETTGVASIKTKGKADTWDSTAPTTGSAPSAEYTQGWQDCLSMHIAPAASHAASVLTDEQIDEVFEPFCGAITHTGGRKYEFARAIESRVIALLAASMAGDKA